MPTGKWANISVAENLRNPKGRHGGQQKRGKLKISGANALPFGEGG